MSPQDPRLVFGEPTTLDTQIGRRRERVPLVPSALHVPCGVPRCPGQYPAVISSPYVTGCLAPRMATNVPKLAAGILPGRRMMSLQDSQDISDRSSMPIQSRCIPHGIACRHAMWCDRRRLYTDNTQPVASSSKPPEGQTGRYCRRPVRFLSRCNQSPEPMQASTRPHSGRPCRRRDSMGADDLPYSCGVHAGLRLAAVRRRRGDSAQAGSILTQWSGASSESATAGVHQGTTVRASPTAVQSRPGDHPGYQADRDLTPPANRPAATTAAMIAHRHAATYCFRSYPAPPSQSSGVYPRRSPHLNPQDVRPGSHQDPLPLRGNLRMCPTLPSTAAESHVVGRLAHRFVDGLGLVSP